MMDGYKVIHGLAFPEEMPDALCELKIWKHWREPDYAACTEKEPWECFWRAIYFLVPEKEFVRNEWSEQHVKDWTTEEFVITWGCASACKSNDYGLLAVVDWMVDPKETVTILASTSVGMLKLRSYESVLRYFQLIKAHAPWQMPGKLRKTDDAIILDDDDDLGATTDKASIRGVAVSDGTDNEARTKLAGAHLPYVRLILDELSQMKPAAMKVRTNLSIGARDFKLCGLCNPDSFTDLAAQYSKPLLPGGFAAIDPETTTSWRSQYGLVRRHDGLRSPAIIEKDGAKRFPFLLTPARLKQILDEHEGNEDDPEVWTMVRGFPPAQGRKQTLISMAEILRSGATGDVKWSYAPSATVLGVDPAFSDGGNRAAMYALEIGIDVDNLVKLSWREPRYIKIESSSGVPVTEQVGNAVAEYAAELGVPANLIGIDDSATQSVADHMQTVHNMVVRRFVSNAKCSEMLIASGDKLKANERYYNQITELWAATAAFARRGQMRNFPLAAAEQLSSRIMEPGKRPLRLLSKKATKAEGSELKSGESYDDQDAASYAIGIARFVLNMMAGSDTLPAKVGSASPFGVPVSGGLRRTARKYDLDARAYSGESA